MRDVTRFIRLIPCVFVAGAILGAGRIRAEDQPEAPSTASSAAPAGKPAQPMTREEKFRTKELTRISNDVSATLPWSMSLEDPKFDKLFPLAISKENPWWLTYGPDYFLVFKFPKSEPFRDRSGRLIKPPGAGHWAYLVAEDDLNYFFQWLPPGENMSEEWSIKSRSKTLAPLREATMGKVDPVVAENTTQKIENLTDYLGIEGYHVPTEPAKIDPETVDVLHFQDLSNGLPVEGLWQMSTVIADLNGDGKLDIVAPPARKEIGGKPHIWLGDGKGNWKHWDEAKFPTEVGFDYGDVGVADFDGDGHPDIALAMHFKGILILYGDGKGNFTKFHRLFNGSGFSSKAMVIADFDGDHRPDLALLSELNMDPKTQAVVVGRMLRVFLYRARDKWEPRDNGTTPHLIGDSLATADLDHDGRPDLICSSHVFGHTALLHLNRGEKGWEILKTKLLSDCYIWGVAGGDVDGDGWDDVVLSYVLLLRTPTVERGGVAILYNDHHGGFSEPQYIVREDRSIPYPVVTLGDLDGDGRLDIVTCAYDGHFRILLQREKGKFFEEQNSEMEAVNSRGMPVQGAKIRDIDGDGRPDLILNYSSESAGGMIRVWKMDQSPKRKAAKSLNH